MDPGVSDRQENQPSARKAPMAFVCETMVHSEVGDQLRRARESKHWSLEEAEKTTGIRKRFLQAMEEGRWDALPGELQVRGFLKSYSNHLGLNGEEMLALHERGVQSAQTTTALQAASPQRLVTVRPAPPQSAKPKPSVTQPTRSATPLSVLVLMLLVFIISLPVKLLITVDFPTPEDPRKQYVFPFIKYDSRFS
jgi:cytoskeletal protein RodZ